MSPTWLEDEVPKFSPHFDLKRFEQCYKAKEDNRDCIEDCEEIFHRLPEYERELLIDLMPYYDKLKEDCFSDTIMDSASFQASESTTLHSNRLKLLDVLAFALYLYGEGLSKTTSMLDNSSLFRRMKMDQERLRLLKMQSKFLPETEERQDETQDAPSQQSQQRTEDKGRRHIREGNNLKPVEQQVEKALENFLMELTLTEEVDHDNKKKKDSMYKKQKKEAEDYYGVRKKDGQVWCTVLHAYSATQRKMAHILPRKMKDENLAAVLDIKRPGPLLYHKKNVLFMHSKIEEYYDRGQLAIIPDNGEPYEKDALKIVVVDRKLLNQTFGQESVPDKGKKFADLDGRRLKFLNDKRPSLRALYLHAVFSFRKAQQEEQLGTWVVKKTLKQELFTGTAWGTPGGIAIDSIMEKLAAGVDDKLMPMIAAGSFVDRTGLDSILYRVSPPQLASSIMNDSVAVAENLDEDAQDEGYRSTEDEMRKGGLSIAKYGRPVRPSINPSELGWDN